MAASVSTVLNVVSIVGGVSAIGFPVAMSTIDGIDFQKISLVECGSQDHNILQEVNYGEKEVREVCGVVKSGDQVQSAGINKEEYSTLLGKQWRQENNQERDGSLVVQGNWKQQCDNAQQKGGITSIENGSEYLGLCKSEEYSKTPFIKKKKEGGGNNQTLKFGICVGSCWNDQSTELGGSKLLQQEQKNNGREIVFKKKR